MLSSAYSEVAMLTGDIPDRKFDAPPGNLPLELLNRYKNRREVVGTCDEKDTMMRRSNQLLLTPENDHFEGSRHLKVKKV